MCLNFRSTDEQKAKHNKQVFNNCLVALKEGFKTDVSTKFLMGFVKGNEKQKSNRVNYMLKEIGLKDRVTATDVYLESAPTTTAKNCEVFLYSRKIDKDNSEKISLKVIPMTSTQNGIKRPCKVGITSRRLKTTTLHNIPL
jgi:hypothetical protein